MGGLGNNDTVASWGQGNPNYFKLLSQGGVKFLCF